VFGMLRQSLVLLRMVNLTHGVKKVAGWQESSLVNVDVVVVALSA